VKHLLAHLVLWLPALAAAAAPATAPNGGEVDVAVAANFSKPLQTLAPLFEGASGLRLVISAGSSGQLATQITQGAPFDVFLSADVDKPKRLEEAGLAVAGSRFTYAVGTLVLWSPEPGVVDARGERLRTGGYRNLSIADPRNAPYGAAAEQVLTHLGLWEPLNRERRIVVGENITQAWQFIASGNAEAGFVALSQVVGPDGEITGSHWLPPQELYTPIAQDGEILTHAVHRDAAIAFMRWLRSDREALAAIRAAGYAVGAAAP